MRKKNGKTIDSLLCKIKLISCTAKLIKQWKSTWLQQKIKIKLQKIHLGVPRQWRPYRSGLWYTMVLIWNRQIFSPSRTQNSNPFKGAWPQVNVPRWREERPQVNQGHTLNSDAGDLQGARHTEVKSRHGVSGHRIQTHVDGVRPTRSPNPASGATWVLVRTPGTWWLGPKGGKEWVPGSSWVPGSFSHPREVLLSWPLLLSDTNCFYSCHDNVEHTALVPAGSILCFPTEVLRKYTRRGARRRGAGLVSAKQGWQTGRRSHSNLTCCLLVFCLILVPWNQLARWTCLPTQIECAENLE